MKKLALLATVALVSISGSAMAIAPGARTIRIDGARSGTAQFQFAFTSGLNIPPFLRGGNCAYFLRWSSPLLGGGTLTCGVRESVTTAFPFCAINQTRNIDGTMFAGPNFASNCSGFHPNGRPFGPQVFLPSAQLTLGERASGGSPTLSGTFFDPSFPFTFQSITID
jgi:hypothetical protein